MNARPFAATVAVAGLLVAGCGGGGGGGGGGGSGNPPQGLAYSSPFVVYEVEVAAPANVPTVGGGPVTSWSVSPALPSGLVLDGASGVVSGMPTAPAPEDDYVVTASNSDGSAHATLTIEVLANVADRLTPKASFTDDDVRHLLSRTHFGGSDADFAAVLAAGVPAYVTSMMTFPASSAVETAADALLVNATDPPGLEGGFPTHAQLALRWLYLMTRTTTPFQERMAFFWHDHFATSTIVVDPSATHWGKAHVDLWREKGNGNLRSLLLDMARDWLMLAWLNGLESTKNAPNENFGREWFELFTLGVDNGYTQADILEAARAFTGYRSRFDATTGQSFVEFSTLRHDPNAKTLFGVTIPAQNVTDDYAAVVDITLDHRPVAEFIARKIFEHFCYEGPKDSVVAELARILRTNGYELVPLLQTLFRSEAFYSDRAKAGLVKGPVDHGVGFIRSTGLHLRNNLLDAGLSVAGQRPTMPPTVNGWPVGSQWLSAQGMLDRANLVLLCITDRAAQAAAGIDPGDLLPPGTPTSAQVVTKLAQTLDVALTAGDHAALTTYLDTQRLGDGTVVASPFDPNNATHVDERVRGLLYVLAQHPTYALR
jgi:uncharacterized protein (DUF1800 family)